MLVVNLRELRRQQHRPVKHALACKLPVSAVKLLLVLGLVVGSGVEKHLRERARVGPGGGERAAGARAPVVLLVLVRFDDVVDDWVGILLRAVLPTMGAHDTSTRTAIAEHDTNVSGLEGGGVRCMAREGWPSAPACAACCARCSRPPPAPPQHDPPHAPVCGCSRRAHPDANLSDRHRGRLRRPNDGEIRDGGTSGGDGGACDGRVDDGASRAHWSRCHRRQVALVVAAEVAVEAAMEASFHPLAAVAG